MGSNRNGLVAAWSIFFTNTAHETKPELCGSDIVRLVLERTETAEAATRLATALGCCCQLLACAACCRRLCGRRGRCTPLAEQVTCEEARGQAAAGRQAGGAPGDATAAGDGRRVPRSGAGSSRIRKATSKANVAFMRTPKQLPEACQ